jgi:N-acetylmuramic acid 6-phosphate (MurNAc-6-P) etherase
MPSDLWRAPDAGLRDHGGGEPALTQSLKELRTIPPRVRDPEAPVSKATFLVGISASGRTPMSLAPLEKLRDLGGITCGSARVPDSEPSRAVQYPIEPVQARNPHRLHQARAGSR